MNRHGGSNSRREGVAEARQDPARVFNPLIGKLKLVYGAIFDAKNILCHSSNRAQDEIGSEWPLPHDLFDLVPKMPTHLIFRTLRLAPHWGRAGFVANMLSRCVANRLGCSGGHNQPDAGSQPISQTSSLLRRGNWRDVFFKHCGGHTR